MKFSNFDNSTQSLSYSYPYQKLVVKKFCSNIAPSIGTGQKWPKKAHIFGPKNFGFLYGTVICHQTVTGPRGFGCFGTLGNIFQFLFPSYSRFCEGSPPTRQKFGSGVIKNNLFKIIIVYECLQKLERVLRQKEEFIWDHYCQ